MGPSSMSAALGHQTDSEITIESEGIPPWGSCHKRRGNNFILKDSSGPYDCMRCFHLTLKSPNVVQIHAEGEYFLPSSHFLFSLRSLKSVQDLFHNFHAVCKSVNKIKTQMYHHFTDCSFSFQIFYSPLNNLTFYHYFIFPLIPSSSFSCSLLHQ